MIEEHDKVYDCPIVQVIPLDRVPVDWTATHSDVQRHTGIGHCVDKTYEHVVEQFRRGVYNLNEDEFFNRWHDPPAPGGAESGELLRDEDGEGLAGRRHQEVHHLGMARTGPHGKRAHGMPLHHSDREERGHAGRRNYGPSHRKPGALVGTEALPGRRLHSIARSAGNRRGGKQPGPDTFHIPVHQSVAGQRKAHGKRPTDRAAGIFGRAQISTDSDVVYPGKVWTVDDPGDIQPFPLLNFPQQQVNYLIDYLNTLLERRTAVSDTTRGAHSADMTATEAHILQESSTGPMSTRTDLFARSFLEPLGRIVLSMLQQFLLDDQIITVRDFSGRDLPLLITPQELQTGRYKVVATLTRQDSSRLAKAQSIERVLPTLAKFESVLAAEGVRISFSELIKRYLDLIGVDGSDRVISRTHPQQDGLGNDSGMPGDRRQLQRPPSETALAGRGEGTHPGALPPRLVERGGPMGPEPTDANALAQLLQMQAAQAVG